MSNFIQRFFWSCAGVDTEVLEACPSDQRKYSSIGVIIFLVASFASIAMYFAASTIVESHFAAIGIALLWGILILMLDRLIVSTIRNDEETTYKDKWIAAIPRIILAAIIAIVISRPIEVKIFSEEIIRQIKKDEILDYNYMNQQLVKGSFLGKLSESDSFLLEKQNKILEKKKKAKEDIPTAIYRDLETKLELAEKQLAIEKYGRRDKDYKFALAELNKLNAAPQSDDKYFEEYSEEVYNPDGSFIYDYKRRLKSEWKAKKTRWRNLIRGVERKINKANREVSKIEQEMAAEALRYRGTLDSEETFVEAQKDSIQRQKQIELDRINQTMIEYDSLNNDSIPSFFTQMKALSNLGYETDNIGRQTGKNLFWWAKWFILLLFFVVEISPVFVKIISPPGSYDEAFQDKQTSDEQIFRDNLNAKAEVANIHRENWKKEQLKMYQNKKGVSQKTQMEPQTEEVIEN